MINHSQDFENALNSKAPKEFYLKFEIFNSNMNYITEVEKQITSGDRGDIQIVASYIGRRRLTRDITIHNRPIRRTFQFALDNSSGNFTFGETNFIWLNKLVKLYIGLKLSNGNIEYLPQGMYWLTQLQNTHDDKGKKVIIQADDRMSKYVDKRGMIINPLTIAAGVNIATAIKDIFPDETMFNFDSITDTVPYEMNFDIGKTRYEIANTLAELAICDLFYDESGYMRLHQINLNDLQNYSPVWTFTNGDYFYGGSTRQLDKTNIANHILVIGGSSSTGTVRCELIVHDNYITSIKTDNTGTITTQINITSSNTYSVDQIGEIIYLHNNGQPDPAIATVSDAIYRAKFELLKRLGYIEILTMDNNAPVWFLDAGDVVQITDSNNGTNGNFLIDSITIPLTLNKAKIECRKEEQVITDWNLIPNV